MFTGSQRKGQKAADQTRNGVPPGKARHALMTSLGQGLGSPERKKAAILDVATALPAEQQMAAAQDIATALPPEAQQDLATSFVKSLDPTQQTEVFETVFGPLDNETRKKILKVVIYTLTAVVFLFGVMTFMLLYQRKAADAPLTLATTALGAIVGLIAISPGGRRPG